jgi:predicted nuclease with TOPRIM domain
MSKPKTARSAARNAPSEERRVEAYEKEFHRLEGQLFKLEAENARLKARVKVLEEAKPEAVLRTMSREELEASIAAGVERLGYVKKPK